MANLIVLFATLRSQKGRKRKEHIDEKEGQEAHRESSNIGGGGNCLLDHLPFSPTHLKL